MGAVRATASLAIARAGVLLAATLVAVIVLLSAQLRATPAATLPAISVSGNALVDGTGARIRLLGVNHSGSEFLCITGGSAGNLGRGIIEGPTDIAGLQSMTSWHANAVRLPLNEDCWLGINGVNPQYGGANYRNVIVNYVNTLHQAGLYVILDLHWSNPGSLPASTQQPLPDLDHAPAFWTSVANAFKNDPATVFDLFNEPFVYNSYTTNPNQDPDLCWRDGCSFKQYICGGSTYTCPYTWQSAGSQLLLNTVRATGATNVVMVGCLGWGADCTYFLQNRPSDPKNQMAVSTHQYQCSTCPTDPTGWISSLNTVIAPIGAQFPIVVGELGDSTVADPIFVKTEVPWFDAHGLSYLGWTWNDWSGYTENVLITNYNGTPTPFYGQWFHDHLVAVGPPPPPLPASCVSSTSAHWFANCSSQQYQLTGNNGSAWADMDTTNLQISFTPTVASVAVISANSSLWTSTAGYNQDMGIAVNGGIYPTTSGQPEAWKESGGSTTLAPNAAFLQTVIPVAASTTYTAKIQWKANQNDPYTIWAGAGPTGNQYSPTRITAWLIPTSPTTEWAKSSTLQYSLPSANGTNWQDIDPTNLSVTFTPPAGGWLAFVSGNADLWTSGGGTNQDLGVAMSGGIYPTTPGQPEAWKESGGPATTSPNAAFVQAPLSVVGGIPYTARLQWKANHSAAGSIWAGAGNGKYSPTSIAVVLVPSPTGGSGASSTRQYPLAGSDGSAWQALDMTNLKMTLAPVANTNYLLSANVDLWTNTIGYGQDIGVMVSGGAFGTGTLVAWQESGAVGTLSPNAAYVFGDVALPSGTYTVWLVWKANHSAPGVTIYAGAGPIGTKYSPIWLTATALN